MWWLAIECIGVRVANKSSRSKSCNRNRNTILRHISDTAQKFTLFQKTRFNLVHAPKHRLCGYMPTHAPSKSHISLGRVLLTHIQHRIHSNTGCGQIVFADRSHILGYQFRDVYMSVFR